jgi:hypothetical protein
LNCQPDGVIRQIRKPFDVLAEGLLNEKSRGDETAIERFLVGVLGWEALGYRSAHLQKPLRQ